MTASTHRESAKIYAFTPRERVTSGFYREDAKSVVSMAAARRPVIDYNCWYHAEAIQESPDLRKR
jgi:Protein of unknown function (DUF2735)